MSEPVTVVLSAEDIRLAVVSYALPVARVLAGGAGLRLGHVEIAEGPAGITGDLSAVVEWERVEDDNEGEADGLGVVGSAEAGAGRADEAGSAEDAP
jgi:hypothetical protein